MDAAAKLAGMLVEGRLKPDVAQFATTEPFGREPVHFGDQRARVDVGRAEDFQRPRRPAPLAQRARKSAGWGKSEQVRVHLRGTAICTKQKKRNAQHIT